MYYVNVRIVTMSYVMGLYRLYLAFYLIILNKH